jgi:hypothetical protein
MLAKRLQLVIVLIPIVVGSSRPVAVVCVFVALFIALPPGSTADFLSGWIRPSLAIIVIVRASLVLARHQFGFVGGDIF